MNHGDFLYLDTLEVNLEIENESSIVQNDVSGLNELNSLQQHRSQHQESVCEQMYMAYAFNWPYFSYATKMNFVFILNAFNPNFI